MEVDSQPGHELGIVPSDEESAHLGLGLCDPSRILTPEQLQRLDEDILALRAARQQTTIDPYRDLIN